MYVMGIDPGFAMTGIAIVSVEKTSGRTVRELKCIETKKSTKRELISLRIANDDHRRLDEIIDKLLYLANDYEIQVAGIESFAARPMRGPGWKSIMAYGAILSFLSILEIPTFVFHPLDIKMGICGKRKASKLDVQKKVEEIFMMDISNVSNKKSHYEHLADALALSLLAEREQERLKKFIEK